MNVQVGVAISIPVVEPWSFVCICSDNSMVVLVILESELLQGEPHAIRLGSHGLVVFYGLAQTIHERRLCDRSNLYYGGAMIDQARISYGDAKC